MFGPLLVADPSFSTRWDEFRADYADEPELPLYIALGELADHLIQRIRRGDAPDIHKVFQVVETWHLEGDEYVREAASIGLLESIQNQLGGNGRDKNANSINAQIEHWLGRESRRWWDKLDRYWGGDQTALSYDD